MESGRHTSTGTARRSLFGPVDHEQLRRELSQRLRDITEQDCRRWNFDFQSHAPLPGRFQWQEVSAGCTADFYLQENRETPKDQTQRSGEAEERLRPRDEEDVPASDQENCPHKWNIPAELTPVRRKRARSRHRPKPHRMHGSQISLSNGGGARRPKVSPRAQTQRHLSGHSDRNTSAPWDSQQHYLEDELYTGPSRKTMPYESLSHYQSLNKKSYTF
ncbi:hypothetical protein WMY93_013635 [Mugilogobius chulae]|uniref:Cyclin-dependent kinase inhibitor domain-containing protein n=1 Tax=Mugilogobius chulae TaxID=88201 RepID=A0AAW0P6L6_9GOBI